MIDVKLFRQDPEAFRRSIARRQDPSTDQAVEALAGLDQTWRGLVAQVEALKAKRNAATEEVAKRKRAKEPADELMAELRESGDRVKALGAELRLADEALQRVALGIPNLPHPSTPDGDATANRVVRAWSEPKTFPFAAKPHWELGETLRLFDLPRGAKITGSGFPLYTGLGARLVRSLANFMLDLHTREHGYREVQPPYLVNRASLTGTGQLPKFEEDMYRTADDLFLIPTAEVPVTNIHRDEILDAADLPKTFVAYTPCFRQEAFSHGKDTRGLIRVHQFDKVELVRLCQPTASDADHHTMTGHAETVLQRLGLPYRVLELAAGDTGFASARTYDLEVWAPGTGAWLEVSSSSTFTDFQARRANVRFRPAPGVKPEFVHTLNASGVAFPRTIIAILENYQEADGSIRVPDVLVPYLGTDRITA
ncbi:MAG: serine--tRNA ligase [Gemmatimonadetes bacterium]|nr:serine--tRNA ligase [Gemmatimonadota bacterium]